MTTLTLEIGSEHANATISGAQWTAGHNGSALGFDGSNDFLQATHLDGITTAFTATAWVQLGQQNNENTIIQQISGTIESHAGANSGWALGTSSGTTKAFNYTITDGNNNFLQETFANGSLDGNWHHLALTWDGATGTAYIDAQIARTDAQTIGSLTNNQDLLIATVTPKNRFTSGTLDEIRVYNRALTETEIRNIYLSNQPITNGLLYQYRLDASGTTATNTPMEVTDHITKLEYSDDIKAIDKLSCTLTRAHSGAEIIENQEVRLRINGQKMFNGYIRKYTDYANYEIQALSNAALLGRTQATERYRDYKLTEIAGSLITTYTTFDTTNIQNNDTTLNDFRAVKSVRTAIDTIADTLNWQWYLDPEDNFYLEPIGTTSSGKTLTVGSNAEKIGKWEYEVPLANDWIVEGGVYGVVVHEDDPDSIGSYGLYAHRKFDNNLTNREDARQLAKTLVQTYKDPIQRGTLTTNDIDPNMRAGRTIIVNDSKANTPITNETFTIKDIRITYGQQQGMKAEVIVGQSDIKLYNWEKDLEKRVENLEQVETGSPLIKLVEVNDTADVSEGPGRFLQIKTRNIGSSAVYDHQAGNGQYGNGSCLYDDNGSSQTDFYS